MSVTVAYLGPEGTFTEAALREFEKRGCFGAESVTPLPVNSPAAALAAVRAGQAQFACVAIENSVDGPVTPTFDALASRDDVQIYHEVDIEVAFSIMVRPGTLLSDVRTFSTHPVARPQVDTWLKSNLPDAEFVPASSNAAAAQAVAEGKADAAAAPARAAEIFGLECVANGIAEMKGARTRFVVVGPRGVPTPRTGHDRTSVMFTLPNEPGSLVSALSEFSHRGVDLSRIESRPTREVFGTYKFHVDLVGHIDDIPVAEALRSLYLRCDDLYFLGSWPAGYADTGNTEREAALARMDKAVAWIDAVRSGRAPEPEN